MNSSRSAGAIRSTQINPDGPAASHPQALVLAALKAVVKDQDLSVRLSGSCMEPHLSTGQQVRIIARNHYWPGDLVVVQASDGRFLCHRFIGVYRRGGQSRWLTQADNAKRPDYSVTRDHLIGVPAQLPDGRPFAIGIFQRLRALLRYCTWFSTSILKHLTPARAERGT